MDFIRFVPAVFAKLRRGGDGNSTISHVKRRYFDKIASD